jgi:hypothetical protein
MEGKWILSDISADGPEPAGRRGLRKQPAEGFGKFMQPAAGRRLKLSRPGFGLAWRRLPEGGIKAAGS